MTRLPAHPVWIWLANLVLPGAGLVWVGFVGGGAALAVAWGLATGGALAGALFQAPARMPLAIWLLGGAAGVLYAAGQAWLALRLSAVRRAGRMDRDGEYRAALAAFLQGRLDESDSICRRLLRADGDDVEAMLQLALVARKRGDVAAARTYLARARYVDDAGRWDFEIRRRLASLSSGPAPGAR
jgi:tetratricopeptide (TPR) repeat protein